MQIDAKQVVVGLLVMLALPVFTGMLIRAKRRELADKMRVWLRPSAIVIFAVVVAMVLGFNMKLLAKFAAEALLPVVLTFAGAIAVGWALAWASRVAATDRRAIAFEIGLQNVAMALGMTIAFFPGLTGAAVTCAMWGAVHVVGGLVLAAAWSRIPTDDAASLYPADSEERRRLQALSQRPTLYRAFIHGSRASRDERSR